jgi:ketosteroid isomerase-like protein
MSNVQVIRQVYERFMRGDVAGILANFSPGIEFRLAEGHPYQPSGQPWFGGDAVTRNFFMRAGSEWEGWTVLPQEFLEMGDAVVVECRYAGVYKPTRKTLDAQVCHVWRFDNGKIASFHQYIDTAHVQSVMDGHS